MKSLLVVPHIYSERFRTRNLELASRWTDRFRVYVWRWHWLSELRSASGLIRRSRQLVAALSDVARPFAVCDNPLGVKLVDAPFLQPALIRPIVGLERALWLARRFNARQLQRVIQRLDIDGVVLASSWFDLPDLKSVPVYHDVVDWFDEDKLSPEALTRHIAWFRSLLSRTAANFVVSIPLQRKLAQDYGARSHFLPNGADVEAVRGVDPSTVARLREQLSLQGLWILGYIGNHDAHAGLDFLLEVFKALHERMPDTALMVVGPYERWKRQLRIPRNAPIRFTDALPPAEMPMYCHLQDVAVHPCEKSQFRDYAFPLKVVEATAARKLVVSTNLLSLREVHFPNLYLVERNVRKWVEALQLARRTAWQREWDHLVAPFDWRHLAEVSAAWME